MADLKNNTMKKKCGARKKLDGTPCKNPAGKRTHHPGEGKCYLHGGCLKGPPLGSKNAASHSIYYDELAPEDQELWQKITINDLDDEIKMIKIRIKRTLRAQRVYEKLKEVAERAAENFEHLDIHELMLEVGVGPGGPINLKRLIKRKRDFAYELDRFTGRLGDLLVKNATLKGEEINAKEKARQIKEALEQIEADADGKRSD